MPPHPRELYRIQDIISAPKSPVLITESREHAEASQSIVGTHMIATYADASGIDWHQLHDRAQVFVWPCTNDESKRKLESVADAVSRHVKTCKLLYDPSAPPDWGPVDALENGMDWERFLSWGSSVSTVVNGSHVSAIAKAVAEVRISLESDGQPGTQPMIDQWLRLGIQVTDKGAPAVNIDSVYQIFKHDPSFGDRVWFDSFYGEVMVTNGKSYRQLEDHDVRAFTIRIQRELGLRTIKESMVFGGVDAYARTKSRNIPREYVDGLKWDGEDRCESFLVNATGCPDNEYTRAVSKNWWIGLAARILDPGSKVDNMLILEGEQGLMKSRLFETIIGERWFHTSHGVFGDDNFKLLMRDHIIIEVGELESFSKVGISQIKNFLTIRHDKWRRPYGRLNTHVPRHCIFVGTTNEQTYLRDHTGNRRFWPVRCAGLPMNIEYTQQNRDNLMAEAKHRFVAGETWWEVPAMAAQEQEMRRQRDDWEEIVYKYTLDKREVTTLEIAENAIGLTHEKVTEFVTLRLSRVLHALGWRHHVTNDFGYRKHVYVRVAEPEDGLPF